MLNTVSCPPALSRKPRVPSWLCMLTAICLAQLVVIFASTVSKSRNDCAELSVVLEETSTKSGNDVCVAVRV